MPLSPLVAIVIFQNCPGSKLKPTKNENVVCFCYMLCSKTMSVELHGRSHPAPKLYEGDLLSGLWTLWVSGVEGYKGFCEVHGFKGLMNRRSLNNFKGLRVPKVQRLMGLKG